MDWKLSLVSFTVLPFVLVPTLRLGRRFAAPRGSAQDDAAELNQILQETITGHQVVKTFGAEDFESNRFRDASQPPAASSNLRYVAQQALPSPLIEFFGALTIVGLLTFARAANQDAAMTAGEFTSFVIALLMLYEPVKRLTGIHNIFQQALGASMKVFEYLDRDQDDRRAARRNQAGKVSNSRFVLDNVGFNYPSAPNGFLLEDIHLEVKAGRSGGAGGPERRR